MTEGNVMYSIFHIAENEIIKSFYSKRECKHFWKSNIIYFYPKTNMYSSRNKKKAVFYPNSSNSMYLLKKHDILFLKTQENE